MGERKGDDPVRKGGGSSRAKSLREGCSLNTEDEKRRPLLVLRWEGRRRRKQDEGGRFYQMNFSFRWRGRNEDFP